MLKFHSILFLILAFPTISLGWSDTEFRNAQDNRFGTIPYINELRKEIEDLKKYKEEKVKRTWLIDDQTEDNEKDTIISNLKKELESIKSNSIPSMEDNEKDNIISNLKKELEDIKKERIQTISMLKNAVNEKESENFKLRKKTDEQLTDLLRDLKDRNVNLSSLENEIDKAEKKSQEDEKTISGLKNGIAKAEKKSQEDEKTISGLKNGIAKAEKKSQEDEKTLLSLENEIANARMKSQEDEKKFNDTVMLDQNIINEISMEKNRLKQDLDQSKKNEELAKQKSKELQNLIDNDKNSFSKPLMVVTALILFFIYFLKNRNQKNKNKVLLEKIQSLNEQMKETGGITEKLKATEAVLKEALEGKSLLWKTALNTYSQKISKDIIDHIEKYLNHYPLNPQQIQAIKSDVEDIWIKVSTLETDSFVNKLKNEITAPEEDFDQDQAQDFLHLIKSEIDTETDIPKLHT